MQGRKIAIVTVVLFISACTDEDNNRDDLRQGDRTRSIFRNLSFEEIDQHTDAPKDWNCFCHVAESGWVESPCRTSTRHSRHRSRGLVLPPNCSAYQTADQFDTLKTVRFDLFARGDNVQTDGFVLRVGEYPNFPKTYTAEKKIEQSDGWYQIVSNSVSTRDRSYLSLHLTNRGATDLYVDDLVVLQSDGNPPHPVGYLLAAEHYTEVIYRDGTEAGQIWLPLPLDYATQVPLFLELSVTPQSILSSLEYNVENGINWGVIVHLKEQGTAHPVVISWHGLVLTRTITEEQRPAWYASQQAPEQWLSATPVVNADHEGIAQTATALVAPDAAAIDRMLAVIDWTSRFLGGTGTIDGLSATAVFESRVASCTGYANLAAALGRALDVPTRTVANYMVGMSQQTHYINEFWLGEALGWRRVEPQTFYPVVPEEYGLVVRLDSTQDEADAAVTDLTRWAASGVPLRSLIEPLAGRQRMDPIYETGHFADCASCDNRAVVQAELYPSDSAPMDVIFETARRQWQRDQAAYLTGGPAPSRVEIRRQFLAATQMEELSIILSQLE